MPATSKVRGSGGFLSSSLCLSGVRIAPSLDPTCLPHSLAGPREHEVHLSVGGGGERGRHWMREVPLGSALPSISLPSLYYVVMSFLNVRWRLSGAACAQPVLTLNDLGSGRG